MTHTPTQEVLLTGIKAEQKANYSLPSTIKNISTSFIRRGILNLFSYLSTQSITMPMYYEYVPFL
jgi:hypothetical protein